jgi:hypothetical protein
MPQPMPDISRTRSGPQLASVAARQVSETNLISTTPRARLPHAVRTFQTCPDCPPYSVPTQPHWLEDFRTKSMGEGEPSLPIHIPHCRPLPLSAVLLDNKGGCAWPDRTTFRKKIQELQQGQNPVSRRVKRCLPAVVAGHVRRTNKCERSSHSSVLSARTGTTQPPRTRRRPPVASSSQSSAIPAASTRRTKRPSRAAPSF